MLASFSEDEPVKVNGTYPQSMYYFYPKDIHALREHIVSHNYPVNEFRETLYGMREMQINDPSGHMIICGQDI